MAYNYYDDSSSFAMDREQAYSNYMSNTFRWMAVGLLVTFGVAFATANSIPLLSFVVRAYLPLTIAELVLVLVFSMRIQTLSRGAATGLFLGYAALNGLVMSFYFLLFDVETLFMGFLCSALFFGLMSWFGLSTEHDLLPMGRVVSIGLISLIVCGLVGGLLGMGFFSTVLYSGIGLALFFFITARDVQVLRANFAYFENDPEMLARCSIHSALSLYLDFINIFLKVLRLLGNRRRR